MEKARAFFCLLHDQGDDQKRDNIDDFITMDKNKYDLIYSRFTFHSINNDQHISFLDTINVNSYLVIETRSKRGENDIVFHGKTHYRNYTDLDYLKTILTLAKFEIIYIQ